MSIHFSGSKGLLLEQYYKMNPQKSDQANCFKQLTYTAHLAGLCLHGRSDKLSAISTDDLGISRLDPLLDQS